MLGPNARQSEPLYFAGTPHQRLADLHAAFADPGTSAVMCLRGGYGSNYLLEDLDFEIIAAHPKPFFAYSDLTGIQLRLLDELGLPLSWPHAGRGFYLRNGVHLKSFLAALAGEPYGVGGQEGMRALKPGKTQSAVARHALRRAASAFSSRSSARPGAVHEGTLLFLEDTGVKAPTRSIALIWQLRSARKLEGVRGIVFGEMLDCVSPAPPPALLEQAILSALEDFDGPIAIGLRSGHVSREKCHPYLRR